MRISDWSSDVCSSDLVGQGQSKLPVVPEIVDIADCRRPRLEEAIQQGLVRVFERFVSQVIVIGHAVSPPVDRELPQMAVDQHIAAWMISCNAPSVLMVGPSSWRQMSGSILRSFMRSVAISRSEEATSEPQSTMRTSLSVF